MQKRCSRNFDQYQDRDINRGLYGYEGEGSRSSDLYRPDYASRESGGFERERRQNELARLYGGLQREGNGDGQATGRSNRHSQKRLKVATERERSDRYSDKADSSRFSGITSTALTLASTSTSTSISTPASARLARSAHSRLEVIKSWQTCGTGRKFGSGNTTLAPAKVISSRMKFYSHGWKQEEGFLIPFFAVVLRHPKVFYLTTGTQRPPELVTRFQGANSELKARFAFTVCRRDIDRLLDDPLVFVTIALKKEFSHDVRKPYVLADFASIMEFLNEYKEVLLAYSSRKMEPPTIDVAFKTYLKDHPELPHPPSYELPTSSCDTGNGRVKVEADNTQVPGHSSPCDFNLGWMSSNMPYRPQTPPVISSMGKKPLKAQPLRNSFAHLTPPPPSAPSAPSPRSERHLPGTKAPLASSTSSGNPSVSARRLSSTSPPPSPSFPQIHLGNGSCGNLSHLGNGSAHGGSTLSNVRGNLQSSSQASNFGIILGIDMPTRRLLSRKYTNLFTKVELGEMIENDLGIFTTDSFPSTGILVDRPLEGVGRDIRKVMSQRYSNLSLVNLCEKLEDDFFIFTKD